MNILRILALIAKPFWQITRRADLQNIIDQVESWMWMETDFLNEASHMEEIEHYYGTEGREAAGEYGDLVVWPLPRREFCSANVLTMDFLEGVMARNFRSIAGNPDYDTEYSLTSFLRGVLRNWMTRDVFYFHGDPHLSNIMIMPGGRLGLVDMGLIGKFDMDMVQKSKDMFLAIYVKDADRAQDILLDLCKVPKDDAPQGFKASLEDYIEEAHHSGLGFWFSGVVDVCVKHNVLLPYDLILFGRMQTVLDGLFKTVLPHKTTMDILGEELGHALRRKILSNIRETDFASLLYVLSEKMKESPASATRFLDRYFDEPLALLRDVASALRGYGRESVPRK
jgi:ubiquinone biosynthesis protein